MDIMEFSTLMAQRGCIGNEKNYCGSYNNYPFTAKFLSGKSGGRTNVLLQIQFNKKIPNKMIKELRKLHRGQVTPFVNRSYTTAALLGGVAGVAVASTMNGSAATSDFSLLSLNISARNNHEFENLLDSTLGQVAAIAPKYNLYIPNVCPVCGRTDCDSYAYIKGSYRSVHAACVQSQAQATHEKAEKNLREGNYGLGIVGAVLGAIIGSLPAVLIQLLTGYLFVLLYALVPLGTYYGYKLFKGKMTKAVLGIVIVIGILMVPVMQYIEFLLDEIIYYGAFYSPAFYFSDISFALTADPVLVLVSWGQMLFFMALGILIVSGIILRTPQADVLDTSFSAASLRPIAPQQPPAAAMPQPVPAPQPAASTPEIPQQ